MANHPPSGLRMGFGFQQAKASGAPYVAPPTADQMNFHLKERTAEKELRTLREGYPEFDNLIRDLILYEKDGYRITAQHILLLVKCEMVIQSGRRFLIYAANGSIYRGRLIKKLYLDGLLVEHEEKTEFFHICCIKNLVIEDTKT